MARRFEFSAPALRPSQFERCIRCGEAIECNGFRDKRTGRWIEALGLDGWRHRCVAKDMPALNERYVIAVHDDRHEEVMRREDAERLMPKAQSPPKPPPSPPVRTQRKTRGIDGIRGTGDTS